MPIIPLAMALAQYVPSIIKLLTGSDKAEEAASQVVGIAQAVTGTSDGDAALASLKADPSKVLDFQQAMSAQQADLEKAYLADTSNARQRDVELAKAGVHNYRANVLAGSALVLVILCLLLVIWNDGGTNDFVKATISLILGRALGWVEQLFSFEFGTTRSSKTKDDTIQRLSK